MIRLTSIKSHLQFIFLFLRRTWILSLLLVAFHKSNVQIRKLFHCFQELKLLQNFFKLPVSNSWIISHWFCYPCPLFDKPPPEDNLSPVFVLAGAGRAIACIKIGRFPQTVVLTKNFDSCSSLHKVFLIHNVRFVSAVICKVLNFTFFFFLLVLLFSLSRFFCLSHGFNVFFNS